MPAKPPNEAETAIMPISQAGSPVVLSANPMWKKTKPVAMRRPAMATVAVWIPGPCISVDSTIGEAGSGTSSWSGIASAASAASP